MIISRSRSQWFPLLLLLLSMFVTVTDSCCEAVSLQDNYCHAAFVLKAKILATKRIKKTKGKHAERMFALDTLKMFKLDKGNNRKINTTELYSFDLGASIALHLDVGKVYVISGGIIDGKLKSFSCAINLQWKYLSSNQKNFFSSKYGKNCNCSIQMGAGFNKSIASRKLCGTKTNKQQHCYHKYSYCMSPPRVGRRDRCRWKINKQVRNCLKNYKP